MDYKKNDKIRILLRDQEEKFFSFLEQQDKEDQKEIEGFKETINNMELLLKEKKKELSQRNNGLVIDGFKEIYGFSAEYDLVHFSPKKQRLIYSLIKSLIDEQEIDLTEDSGQEIRNVLFKDDITCDELYGTRTIKIELTIVDNNKAISYED